MLCLKASNSTYRGKDHPKLLSHPVEFWVILSEINKLSISHCHQLIFLNVKEADIVPAGILTWVQCGLQTKYSVNRAIKVQCITHCSELEEMQ